jgi:hypothetical protein
MREEIFGPVVTVRCLFLCFFACILIDVLQVYVYEDDDFDKTLDLIDTTSEYALTGAMCAPKFPCLCVIDADVDVFL